MCKARQKSAITARATVRNYFLDLPLRQKDAIEQTNFLHGSASVTKKVAATAATSTIR
jgi:hypothetical protein